MNACDMKRAVDAHFLGTIEPADETKLRAHLASCPSCHARYRRRLLLAQLDPEAPPAEVRLGRALGIEMPAQDPPLGLVRRFGRAAGGLAMAAVILLGVRFAPRGSTDDGFTARGSLNASATPQLFVYRAESGGAPEPARGSLHAGDELAFAFSSDGAYDRLMIFGVDERGRVFWYHPAWTDPEANPAAIRITSDGARHELREAIRHDLSGARLEVHAVFLDHDVTVDEMERAIAARTSGGGALTVPGAVDVVVPFEVLR